MVKAMGSRKKVAEEIKDDLKGAARFQNIIIIILNKKLIFFKFLLVIALLLIFFMVCLASCKTFA